MCVLWCEYVRAGCLMHEATHACVKLLNCSRDIESQFYIHEGDLLAHTHTQHTAHKTC